MAVHGAQPRQRRRMSVEHADDAAMRRQAGEQALDMGAGVHEAALARAAGRGPAGVEPVGRGHGKKPDVAAVFRHQTDRLDRFRRDRAGIGDHDLAIRPGLAQPIGAVDDRLAQRRRHRALDLLDRSRGQPQINRAAGFVAQPVALARLAFRRPAECSRARSARMTAARRRMPARTRRGRPAPCRSAVRRSTDARRLPAPA